MKICIDGIGASWLKGTGLYTYTYELLNNLFELYPQPQYKIIWDNPNPPPWKGYGGIDFVDPELDRRNNDYSRLDRYISDNKINIFHSPNNGLSIAQNNNCKNIITVHDLIPLVKPEFADNRYLEKFNAVFQKSLNNAHKIAVVSDYIKTQLVNELKVDENKVITIYPGCSKKFSQMDRNDYLDVLKKKYYIEGEYILYAGSVHIRKNFDLLFKAFRRVLRYRDNVKLLIAGKTDGKRKDYYESLKKSIEGMGIEKNVVFLGEVEYSDMPALYNGAACTVNLSSYEGFPTTAVEAMACGCPVICLKSSVFKETVGEGAILVKDEDELKDELIDILKSSSYRKRTVERGLRQSQRYTWDNHIKKLVSVYESAVYGS